MAPPPPNPAPERERPRLTLFSPPIEDAPAWSRAATEALSGTDIAAVVLQLAPAAEGTLIERIKCTATPLQARGIAVVLRDHPDLAARGGADGAHLNGIAALQTAIGRLKPDRIAGAGGLASRHDAMLAGETGADYVMFGEPDGSGRRPDLAAILERIRWWAEIFEPPCIGYAASLDEVAPLAAAGADFVALGDWVWIAESGAAAAIRAAARRLSAAERVA